MSGILAALPSMLSTVIGFLISPVGRLIAALIVGLTLGWIERGAHDDARSDQQALQAQAAHIKALESDLESTRQISEAANERARSEAEMADQLRRQTDDYAAQLAQRNATQQGQDACTLSDEDLRRLQSPNQPHSMQQPGGAELREARPARRAR